MKVRIIATVEFDEHVTGVDSVSDMQHVAMSELLKTWDAGGTYLTKPSPNNTLRFELCHDATSPTNTD